MSLHLQKALQTYKSGNYRKALSFLTPVLKQANVPVEALLIAAQCHVKVQQYAEAAEHYGRAAILKTGADAVTLHCLTAKMSALAKDYRQALAAAHRARGFGFTPDAEETYRRVLQYCLVLDEAEDAHKDFLAKLRTGNPVYLAIETVFDHINWCGDEDINGRLTHIQDGKPFTAETHAVRRAKPHEWGEKIRIGYLSNDVCDQHATMRLFQGVLLAHDQEKYDVTMFCYTPPDVKSADEGMRKKYPNLVAMGHMDDAQAEQFIRKRGIDILVDLKGHTKDARIGLVNRGVAPIQVAYLGFPGSVNGIDCDYVISDAIVTPDSSKPHYHEKLCRLPECYQANDDRFRLLPPAASRQSLGLPEDRIVFASFNTHRKITAETGRLWSNILKQVEDSILWIMCSDPFAQENLVDYMQARGITRERIVFTASKPYAEHVARLQAADIGLDTFPCNGHTTTSDKLWAGLPVATKKGSNFASRVSESLLNALGVPELVAADDDDYVRLCVELARDHEKRAAIRQKIADNRFSAPLFDTERFTRHLEQAYEMMAERAKAGLEPDHIDVPALPPRTHPFGTRSV
ncbi:MAG: hypothetical protein BGN83_00050 [Rhizobium sp. 63-7]|nr:MAG: hypothetical protein BGN83_00050 [Rhizobium sp. 63-7]